MLIELTLCSINVRATANKMYDNVWQKCRMKWCAHVPWYDYSIYLFTFTSLLLNVHVDILAGHFSWTMYVCWTLLFSSLACHLSCSRSYQTRRFLPNNWARNKKENTFRRYPGWSKKNIHVLVLSHIRFGSSYVFCRQKLPKSKMTLVPRNPVIFSDDD